MTCICGHEVEDHDGPGGCCSVEECDCACYDEEIEAAHEPW